MHTRSVMEYPAAHGSILGRIPVSEHRLRESQEIKVAKNGRGISFLHNAAAGAPRILSLDFAAGFNQKHATTCWIEAMPAFAGFHDHGPFSSLRKNDWKFAKAMVVCAQPKWVPRIIIIKQTFNKNWTITVHYVTRTHMRESHSSV